MRIREVTERYRVHGRCGNKLTASEQVVRTVRAIVGDDPREHFGVIFLDGRSQSIDWVTISVGTVDSALVHPREVFRRAIRLDASAIIIAHTHPSDDPQPSPEDHEVTRRLRAAGDILGIPVRDHVIVSATGHYSFAAAGCLA